MTDTKSIEYKHTQSAQCRWIKTNTTERLIANLEVKQPQLLNQEQQIDSNLTDDVLREMLHFLPTITLWSGTLSEFNHFAHLHFTSLDLNYANFS